MRKRRKKDLLATPGASHAQFESSQDESFMSILQGKSGFPYFLQLGFETWFSVLPAQVKSKLPVCEQTL